MPCLEVVMPEVSSEVRKDLAANLTRAFADASGFPAEIFGIFFQEYKAGQAATGGELFKDAGRPFLHFRLYSPRLSRSAKQKIVAALTEAFVKGVGKPEWKPDIHLAEHPYDNIGVDGMLLSDAYKECAEKKFYYELPEN